MNIKRPPLRELWISVKKKGRFLIGTVFFLCLIIGYGVYQGYWEDTGKPISASDIFTAVSRNGEELSNHKQGKSNTNTDTGQDEYKAKLVNSVRNVLRPDSLRDPFLTESRPINIKPLVATTSKTINRNITSDTGLIPFSTAGKISPPSRRKNIEIVGLIKGQWPMAILRVEGKELSVGVGNQGSFSVLQITDRGVFIEEGGEERWV